MTHHEYILAINDPLSTEFYDTYVQLLGASLSDICEAYVWHWRIFTTYCKVVLCIFVSHSSYIWQLHIMTNQNHVSQINSSFKCVRWPTDVICTYKMTTPQNIPQLDTYIFMIHHGNIIICVCYCQCFSDNMVFGLNLWH